MRERNLEKLVLANDDDMIVRLEVKLLRGIRGLGGITAGMEAGEISEFGREFRLKFMGADTHSHW
jgi:hypothetical protein